MAVAKWRTRFAAALIAASMCAGVGFAEDAELKESQHLPLSRIVLFNAGVGFYEHTGEVTDNAQVEMKFQVKDINDLLKSLVVQDLAGGKVSTVTYGSKEPITRALRSFAIDLTSEPSLADLLAQIRGEKIEIESANTVTGTIIGIEERENINDKGQSETQEFVVLLTPAGIRKIDLATASTIRLTNPRLNEELNKALELLAQAKSSERKSVTLDFLGEGKRPVRVGYIQESPVWKTSYRLVLDQEEAPYLQGWAIVENTTEDDWKDVNLSLVSGRPISFVMNLYDPLFATRPEAQLNFNASVRPQTYDSDLSGGAKGMGMGGMGGMMGRPSVESEELALDAAAPPRAARTRALASPASPVPQSESLSFGFSGREMAKSMQNTAAPDAQGSEVGELFSYNIATPVTLPRQQSAMLPIVGEAIEAEKLSIYNRNAHVKHPLNGLRLKNTTDLHLMQGPITVFDDGVFAGDAQIADLPAGAERLVSYAMDLEVEVAPPETKLPAASVVSVVIRDGALQISRKVFRNQIYKIKNSGKSEKKLLIEQPIEAPWKLTSESKPTETTRDLYRFLVELKPEESAEYVVKEEQFLTESFTLTDIQNDRFVWIHSSNEASQPVKDAMVELQKRNRAIQEVVQQRQAAEQQIGVVEQEQNRIRQNMAQLDRNSDLYNRYVKMFGEQEDQVLALRAKIKQLQDREAELRKELNSFISKLNIK